MSETKSLKCLLCNKDNLCKSSLTLHLYHHFSYRKYRCSTCTALFYSEEEREAHCKQNGHVHTFEMRFSPYCELYVNQLIKDAEYETIYGIDIVIMHRSKANLSCDDAINESDSITQHSSNRKSRTTELASPSDTLSPSAVKKVRRMEAESSAKATRKPLNVKRDQWRFMNDSNIRTEIAKFSIATDKISEALQSIPSETHCMICNILTPSEYVLRKLHVSTNHVSKDHTPSDYVEILSEMMKKAYPTLPYNDFQCQIGGCKKECKTQSARRNHVLRTHFQHELCCPLGCSYRSNDFSHVNSHLKGDHGLKNGYLSITTPRIREQFSSERSRHNYILNYILLYAFPCPVPDFKHSTNRAELSSSFNAHGLISKVRERDRQYQQAPPNPVLRSPSSSSDPDSSESDESQQCDRISTTINSGLPNDGSKTSTSSVTPSTEEEVTDNNKMDVTTFAYGTSISSSELRTTSHPNVSFQASDTHSSNKEDCFHSNSQVQSRTPLLSVDCVETG